MSYNRKYGLIVFGICTWINVCVYSQSKDLKFVNYENINGLENRSCIVRDSSGYIWLSGNGIGHFDGTQFKEYHRNENQPNSLRSDNTWNLIVDKNGLLWATSGGLCFYDRSTDGFIYVDKGLKNKFTFTEAVIYDGKETIWFCCDLGLCSININTKIITETSFKKYSYINKGTIDKKGNIWMCTTYGQLFIYNPSEDKFKAFIISDNLQLATLNFIFADKQNKIWIVKNIGIIKIDPENLTDNHGKIKYEVVRNLQNVSVSLTALGCIQYLPAYTGDSILWIATSTHGLIAFNILTQNITATFLPDKSNPHSISANTPISLYVDKQDQLWITHVSGLSLLNIHNQNFKSRIISELKNEMHSDIQWIEQDKSYKSIVWIGTYHGLIKYNWDQKKPLKWIKKFGSSNSTNANTISDDGKGNLWIGTENALFKYRKQTGKFTRYPSLPTENKFNYPTIIFGIISLNNSILIASSTGVLAYIPETQKFKIIYSGKDNGIDSNSFCIFQMKRDNNGVVWGAGAKGLIKIDLANNLNTVYLFNDKQNFFGFNRFTGLDFDGNNIVLAASAGVVLFNKSTKQFTKLSSPEDVELNNSWDLKVDTLHNIWITTYYGLVFYNQKKKIHKTFTAANGLPRTFSGVPLDMINNTLVFKSKGKFAYIDPYSVENNSNIPQPVISAFKIYEKPVFFDHLQVFQKPLNLSYKQNFISFDFNAFEFNYPDKLQFAYRLIGLDNDWVFCGNKKNTSYTNLSPGNYIFEMKSANSEGLWSKPASFKIYIKPAIWQTLWFKTFGAILIILIIYWFIKRRITQIKDQEERKTSINKMVSDLEMKALRSQINPHFIFNSLNSIQKFIWENKQEDASEYLTKFSKLIRLILDHSMHKLITLEQELSMLSLYLELEHRRSNNKYDYILQVDSSVKPSETLIPPMIFQPYIENAIWHGLLHKLTRGKLSIHMYQSQIDLLVCIIQDDGIGRKASTMIKGQKSKNSVSYGMQITQDRLKIMEENGKQGNIIMEDLYDIEMQAIGTKITVEIPITTFTKFK